MAVQPNLLQHHTYLYMATVSLLLFFTSSTLFGRRDYKIYQQSDIKLRQRKYEIKVRMKRPRNDPLNCLLIKFQYINNITNVISALQLLYPNTIFTWYSDVYLYVFIFVSSELSSHKVCQGHQSSSSYNQAWVKCILLYKLLQSSKWHFGKI